MIYAGLDYSITCPGLCIYDSAAGALSYDTCQFFFNQHNPTKKEQSRWSNFNVQNIHPRAQYPASTDNIRFYNLTDWVLSIVMSYNVDMVIMEDYAFGAKGKVFNLAENAGLVKFWLTVAGIPVTLIAPTENKKMFYGKGNAKKDQMIEKFNELNGINISEIFAEKNGLANSPISDIVDAYSLIYSYLIAKE